MNDISRGATYSRGIARTGETLVFSIIGDTMKVCNSVSPLYPSSIWQHRADIFGLGT